MTMSPLEIERKVRQVDNDVQSIYVMLSAIQGTQTRHSNRFEELAEKLDNVDQKVGGRLDAHDARFDNLERRLDAHDARFDNLDGKLDSVLELLRGEPPASG